MPVRTLPGHKVSDERHPFYLGRHRRPSQSQHRCTSACRAEETGPGRRWIWSKTPWRRSLHLRWQLGKGKDNFQEWWGGGIFFSAQPAKKDYCDLQRLRVLFKTLPNLTWGMALYKTTKRFLYILPKRSKEMSCSVLKFSVETIFQVVWRQFKVPWLFFFILSDKFQTFCVFWASYSHWKINQA